MKLEAALSTPSISFNVCELHIVLQIGAVKVVGFAREPPLFSSTSKNDRLSINRDLNKFINSTFYLRHG